MSAKRVKINTQPGKDKASADSWVNQRKAENNDPDMSMKRLTIDVPEHLHRDLKMLAAQEGIKMADLVREWIQVGVKSLKS